MNSDLLYLAAVALITLCMAVPALLRHRAISNTETLMSDFCRAPTRAKAARIEFLLGRYGVYGCELDRVLYARWLNVRLAMDRLNSFRSNKVV